jgi:[ribosomal protein S5]-alanine N-acetyltransferase
MRLSDAEAIHAIKGDDGVTKRYGQEPHRSLDETRRWVKDRVAESQRDSIFWVFVPKEDSRAIGSCCFWNFDRGFKCAELGYELRPDHWGRGIMSEALPPVLTYGFDKLRLHRIEACPFADNEASRNLLLRLGFKYEGSLRERHRFRGRYLDLTYYGLLKDEWDRPQRRIPEEP